MPGGRPPDAAAAAVVVRVPYRRPFSWAQVLAFLAPRAIPGVEITVDGRWRRTVRVGAAIAVVEVEDEPYAGALVARLTAAAGHALDETGLAVVSRCLTRVFDLDADAGRIDAVLGRDPLLAADVADRPGVRVPGAVDGWEMAVRAVLGQQVSVAAARTLAGRIAGRWGPSVTGTGADGPVRFVFPDAAALADADLASVGVMPARAASIRALARALASAPDLLAPGAPSESVLPRLGALPGIGPWTAQYLAMRALRDPDALPAGDLGLRRALGGADVAAAADRWRPWRAYGAMRLWTRQTG